MKQWRLTRTPRRPYIKPIQYNVFSCFYRLKGCRHKPRENIHGFYSMYRALFDNESISLVFGIA
jgi:hypothetical protein